MATWIKSGLTKQGVAEGTAELMVDSLAENATKLSYDVKTFMDFLASSSCSQFMDAARVENRYGFGFRK